MVSCAVAQHDIVVGLNADARFAIPFCDRYWSRILNGRRDYEEEIEAFLKSVADIRYTFVDCGANCGYWSVLVSNEPFGRQTILAIEASPDNAARLALNAGLNGNRYRCMNAATVKVGPGLRYDVVWTARKPGKWLVHCHIPHHTANNNVEQQGGGGLMLVLDVK